MIVSSSRVSLPQIVDAAGYAAWSTVAAVFVSGLVSLVAGAGAVGVKYGLFLIGFGLFGYSIFLLKPSKPGSEPKVQPRGDTRFEARTKWLPPHRWFHLAPADRLRPGTKLFLASLTILAMSYLMESLLGIHV